MYKRYKIFFLKFEIKQNKKIQIFYLQKSNYFRIF